MRVLVKKDLHHAVFMKTVYVFIVLQDSFLMKINLVFLYQILKENITVKLSILPVLNAKIVMISKSFKA